MAQTPSYSPLTTSDYHHPAASSCEEPLLWDPQLVDPLIFYSMDLPTISLMPPVLIDSTISDTDSFDHLGALPCNPIISVHTHASSSLPLCATATATQQGTKRSRDHTSTEESTGSETFSAPDMEEERLQEKRRRNKMASRRLRQRQVEHVSELESRLNQVTEERDGLRLQLAKWEAEVAVLRSLVGQQIT
ncbi:bZIP transcription factor JlbA/IDI-4 [Aspergillus saccharolyticus JOP 1030-1]|uniref:BZIP domain-containing protein n=1 Tax=Aspergillus saccharolyticus JOP 1030-1 TaxID=1450539 RepID=A0A318Z6J4_9EURO|nr:hypothetical protein BP01DRAFT_127069 [Aspergillus saccharolyticus JOP 1030-1]PYH42921.1 hypothetical protein BP01DRAFT_127069 [Aspergillus saccharolyticus JOP 1030-1]